MTAASELLLLLIRCNDGQSSFLTFCPELIRAFDSLEGENLRREFVKPQGASEARYRAHLSVRDAIFKPHNHCIGPRRGRSLGAKTEERQEIGTVRWEHCLF